jgi:hypothetical protein
MVAGLLKDGRAPPASRNRVVQFASLGQAATKAVERLGLAVHIAKFPPNAKCIITRD